jgi:hypothetical protein
VGVGVYSRADCAAVDVVVCNYGVHPAGVAVGADTAAAADRTVAAVCAVAAAASATAHGHRSVAERQTFSS